jgi:hypothetical protein
VVALFNPVGSGMQAAKQNKAALKAARIPVWYGSKLEGFA